MDKNLLVIQPTDILLHRNKLHDIVMLDLDTKTLDESKIWTTETDEASNESRFGMSNLPMHKTHLNGHSKEKNGCDFFQEDFDEALSVTEAESIESPRSDGFTIDGMTVDYAKTVFPPITQSVKCSTKEDKAAISQRIQEIISRGCPYSSDKQYDEIVQIRQLKNKPKSSLLCSPTIANSRVVLDFENSSTTFHRQPSYSSSGSLLNNLPGISFHPDQVVVPDEIKSLTVVNTEEKTEHEVECKDKHSKKAKVQTAAAKYDINVSNILPHVEKGILELECNDVYSKKNRKLKQKKNGKKEKAATKSLTSSVKGSTELNDAPVDHPEGDNTEVSESSPEVETPTNESSPVQTNSNKLQHSSFTPSFSTVFASEQFEPIVQSTGFTSDIEDSVSEFTVVVSKKQRRRQHQLDQWKCQSQTPEHTLTSKSLIGFTNKPKYSQPHKLLNSETVPAGFSYDKSSFRSGQRDFPTNNGPSGFSGRTGPGFDNTYGHSAAFAPYRPRLGYTPRYETADYSMTNGVRYPSGQTYRRPMQLDNNAQSLAAREHRATWHRPMDAICPRNQPYAQPHPRSDARYTERYLSKVEKSGYSKMYSEAASCKYFPVDNAGYSSGVMKQHQSPKLESSQINHSDLDNQQSVLRDFLMSEWRLFLSSC